LSVPCYSADGENFLPAVSPGASGLPTQDAWKSVYYCCSRQYRSQYEFDNCKVLLPWHSYLTDPTCQCRGRGVDRTIVVTGGTGDASTFICQLPQYYTGVPPVTSSVKNVPVPAARVTSLDREAKQHTEEEYLWLHNARQVLDGNAKGRENISLAAFHASHQPPEVRLICPTALLPMFQDSAHTVAMICHSLDIVKNAIKRLNPRQTLVVTFDHSLFALIKQIQWKWPEKIR